MNSQRETELKPCPFCGSSPHKAFRVSLAYTGKTLECYKCNYNVPVSNWNTRQAATEQGVGEAVAWYNPEIDSVITAKTYNQTRNGSIRGYTTPLYTHPPKPTGGGVPDGWSFRKQGDSILVQYHENGGFVKGRWIDKQSERFSFEFFEALLATQQPPEQE